MVEINGVKGERYSGGRSSKSFFIAGGSKAGAPNGDLWITPRYHCFSFPVKMELSDIFRVEKDELIENPWCHGGIAGHRHQLRPEVLEQLVPELGSNWRGGLFCLFLRDDETRLEVKVDDFEESYCPLSTMRRWYHIFLFDLTREQYHFLRITAPKEMRPLIKKLRPLKKLQLTKSELISIQQVISKENNDEEWMKYSDFAIKLGIIIDKTWLNSNETFMNAQLELPSATGYGKQHLVMVHQSFENGLAYTEEDKAFVKNCTPATIHEVGCEAIISHLEKVSKCVNEYIEVLYRKNYFIGRLETKFNTLVAYWQDKFLEDGKEDV